MLPMEDPEYTPYVNEKLPWEPLLPAFGLEEFGLPVPRRNAETWRHFDVIGMVNQDYSASTEGVGKLLKWSRPHSTVVAAATTNLLFLGRKVRISNSARTK